MNAIDSTPSPNRQNQGQSGDTTKPTAIVFTAAGWATAALSAYGSAWLETPTHNLMAAQGITFDRYVADCDQSGEVLKSIWSAIPAWMRNTPGVEQTEKRNWIRGLIAQDDDAVFVTDDAKLGAEASGMGFSEVIIVEIPAVPVIANDLVDTHVVRLIAAALERRRASHPALLWIHSESLERIWDAPLDDRGRWFDDDELEPRDDVVPPQVSNQPPIDEDELLRWIMCYADQISVVDHALSKLFAAYNTLTNEVRSQCLLVTAGTSGMALGEHDWIGPKAGVGLSPRTHLPLVIVGQGEPLRIHHLAQPFDLGFTLASHLSQATSQATDGMGQCLLDLISPEQWVKPCNSEIAVGVHHDLVSIQSDHWHWVSHRSGKEQLFLKPDDRFDANDIASRAVPVCAAFRAFAEKYFQSKPEAFPELVAELYQTVA